MAASFDFYRNVESCEADADVRSLVVGVNALRLRINPQPFKTAARHGRRFPRLAARCAMREYAAHCRARGEDGRWRPLSRAAEAEGVPIGNTHRAADDCRLTLAIVRAVAARHRAG